MNLTETTTLSSAVFPVAEFKEHLKLGSGFGDDAAQDMLLETCLRAAMGAIEARTNQRLIYRGFSWNLNAWRLDAGAQALPVSPVSAVIQLRMYAPDGSSEVISSSKYGTLKDSQRPKLFPKEGVLPAIVPNGFALITFYAGYGNWSKVPADLRQAMLMLAASYYENRDAMTQIRGQIPMGVAALLEPYKRLRLGGAP